MDPLPIDLQTAAHRQVAQSLEFADLLISEWVGQDDDGTAWLFQGLDNEGRPFRDPEGSGKAVIVLSHRDDWSGANAHNTAGFPTLQVLIYADSTRDENGSPVVRDAEKLARAVFSKIDRVLHNPATFGMDWSGYRVHSCLRTTGFSLQDVPGTQAYCVRGESRYEIVSD